MKVLFVLNDVISNTNKYISTLKNALITEGIEATRSVDEFWNNYQKYDIIHYQLLESSLFHRPLNVIIEHIERVKKYCKIIVTCHDINLYYIKDEKIKSFMEYIYNHCDAMIHLGNYSYNYYINKLDKKIKHFIIPHHIYDSVYKFSLDKSVARKKLNIPFDANVLLCFGIFRNDNERRLVLKAWKRAKIENKYLLAPTFYHINMRRRNIIFLFLQRMKAWYYRFRGVHLTNEFIPHDRVETYLCASDILMIQRVVILNSGNLSLGFHAQKVVVGPKIGNVGEILEETGNPVFNPNDISSVAKAIQEGFRLKDTDLPQKNHEYAMKNWNVSLIARKHIEAYQEILGL